MSRARNGILGLAAFLIFTPFRVAVRDKVARALRVPKQPTTVTRARRLPEKTSRILCVSLTRTLQQTHHAVLLLTLFLFPRTSLSLVASPDVSHLEQGARSTTACVCSFCAWTVIEEPGDNEHRWSTWTKFALENSLCVRSAAVGHVAQVLAHQESCWILIHSDRKTVVMEVGMYRGGCHNSLAPKMDRGLTRVIDAQCFSFHDAAGSTREVRFDVLVVRLSGGGVRVTTTDKEPVSGVNSSWTLGSSVLLSSVISRQHPRGRCLLKMACDCGSTARRFRDRRLRAVL